MPRRSVRHRAFALDRALARAAALAALAWLAATSPVQAYRTLQDLSELSSLGADGPVTWPVLPVELELSTAVAGPLDAELTQRALQDAIETWNDTLCAPDLLLAGGYTSELAVMGDGFNTVQWITEGWTDLAPADAAAATDLAFEGSAQAGFSLLEADVYINADTQRWVAPGSIDAVHAVQAVITHELGHVLGLSHPCEPDGAGGAPVCNPLDFPLTAMHPLYDPGQFQLAEDDLAGLCYLYPDPCAGGACDPDAEPCEPGAFGCEAAPASRGDVAAGCSLAATQAGPARSAPAALLSVALLVGVALVRRRLRRS